VGPQPDAGSHVCLVGAGVTNNWSLIEPLKRDHQVTMIERARLLFANSILATASVVVLDCGEEPRLGLNAVKVLRRVYPDVDVVLVNGALTPSEIAEAFREGVRDYFSHQSSADLVVERVQSLCRQARRASGRGNGSAAVLTKERRLGR
jgi:DNA-binding NarL/FixJ family response regulator